MKLTIKILAGVVGVVLLLVLAALAVFWINPDPWVRRAIPAVEKAAQGKITLGKISGNPLSGWSLQSVEFRSEQLSLSIPEVEVGIQWTALLFQKLLVDSLIIKEPKVDLNLAENRNRIP